MILNFNGKSRGAEAINMREAEASRVKEMANKPDPPPPSDITSSSFPFVLPFFPITRSRSGSWAPVGRPLVDLESFSKFERSHSQEMLTSWATEAEMTDNADIPASQDVLVSSLGNEFIMVEEKGRKKNARPESGNTGKIPIKRGSSKTHKVKRFG